MEQKGERDRRFAVKCHIFLEEDEQGSCYFVECRHALTKRHHQRAAAPFVAPHFQLVSRTSKTDQKADDGWTFRHGQYYYQKSLHGYGTYFKNGLELPP